MVINVIRIGMRYNHLFSTAEIHFIPLFMDTLGNIHHTRCNGHWPMANWPYPWRKKINLMGSSKSENKNSSETSEKIAATWSLKTKLFSQHPSRVTVDAQLEKVFLPPRTVFLRRNFPNIEEKFF